MKAGVHIVDLPMKVAVENVKRECEICDSSQASLNFRSHNYGILQIQKFENLVKSLKYVSHNYRRLFIMTTP